MNEAADILSRARNKVGFHWDEETIGASVREFGKNNKLVWMEVDANNSTVHRLASDVLAHVLFPVASLQDSDDTKKRALVDEEMAHIRDAMNIIIEFCAASAFGYMHACGAVLRRNGNDTPA